MDRFYIAQRVRILAHPAYPQLDGQVGRIVGRIRVVRRSEPPVEVDSYWLVSAEGEYGDPPSPASPAFVLADAQLETCPPEGAAAVEWIDCAWRPEQVPEPVEVPRPRGAQRLLRALARRFER
jgi:hypothetical protein